MNSGPFSYYVHIRTHSCGMTRPARGFEWHQCCAEWCLDLQFDLFSRSLPRVYSGQRSGVGSERPFQCHQIERLLSEYSSGELFSSEKRVLDKSGSLLKNEVIAGKAIRNCKKREPEPSDDESERHNRSKKGNTRT